MSITRVRVVILVQSERGRQWLCARTSLYGTGSSSAHAYYVTKWRTTYTVNIIVHAEKLAFRRSFYFLKTVISCTAR